MPVLRAGRGERAAAHGAFDRAARAVIARFRRPGPLALALVLTTAALSCVATNDMALIMMLPLSAATLMGANLPRLVAPVFVLLSLAANLCGMIVPFGNPQNLYLYSYYGLDLGDFLAAMALPFALSTAGHRRLHLVAVRSVERQLWPRRYAQSRRADAAQPDGAWQSTERLSPSLCWPYSASCPSPPPSPS